MPLSQLNVHRHDRKKRSLITLAGEIDLGTAPRVRETLEECLRDGVRTIDVDLASLTFCDCSGLNVFIEAWQHTVEAGGSLRLHHPPYTLLVIVDVTDTGFLLVRPPSTPKTSPHPTTPAASPTLPSFQGLRRLVTAISAARGVL
ncbi:STAS domain-containing protein [Streptomyces sp. NPDC087263]|uniref:STAS domain-containing protein n=1 Tax=Streptomyces sp. NPDC087263 TaxID=3365773 RepID=UPI0037F63EE4